MRELGAALRVLRAIRNVTQRQLAQAAGVTPGMLCQYETDRQNPTLPSLSSLLSALGFGLCALEEVAGLVVRLKSGVASIEPPRERPAAADWSSLRFDVSEPHTPSRSSDRGPVRS